MAVTPTTRWQVNGYRFLVRRMEHALVRRDVRMLHDPMRSQSRALAVGVVIASLGLAGCAALALFRPQDKIGDASIVVGKDSGAMFVVMGDTLRPVLNLASARLIVGKSENPVIVKESELDTRPRGALVGIPRRAVRAAGRGPLGEVTVDGLRLDRSRRKSLRHNIGHRRRDGELRGRGGLLQEIRRCWRRPPTRRT